MASIALDISSSSDEERLLPGETCKVDKELATWFDFSHQVAGVQQYLWSNAGADVSRLPRRRIPPGNTAKLFLVYVAQSNDSKVTHGSYPHFRRQWLARWRKVLEFGCQSEHQACDACYAFKMHRGRDGRSGRNIDVLAESFEHVVTYQRHLNSVSQDRSFTWSCMEQAFQACMAKKNPPFSVYNCRWHGSSEVAAATIPWRPGDSSDSGLPATLNLC